MGKPRVHRTARFSECGTWRYELRRVWTPGAPLVQFVGLNPSVADWQKDDPTIRILANHAKRWGYGGLVMTNAYALVATDPTELLYAPDPKGPENDRHLAVVANQVALIVVCWGSHRTMFSRRLEVCDILKGRRLMCLGKCEDGNPRHPLRNPVKVPEVWLPWTAQVAIKGQDL